MVGNVLNCSQHGLFFLTMWISESQNATNDPCSFSVNYPLSELTQSIYFGLQL